MNPSHRALTPGPATLIALGIAVPIALSPVKTHDLFFHLAGAKWFLAHGFPKADPFSFTASSGWVPHEYGFGVIALLISRMLGGAGIELFIAVLVAAMVSVLWAVLRHVTAKRGLVVFVLFVLGLYVHNFTWPQERPYHVSHLLFALTLLLCAKWLRPGSAKVLLWLPPLVALWSNMHGSWLLGPALLGAVAAGDAVDRRALSRRQLFAVAACVAAFLAAAISPLGLSTYLYPLHHSTLASTQLIEEWQPLRLSYDWAKAFVVLGVVVLLLVLFASRRRFAWIIPAFVLAAAALLVQRHAPFAALALIVCGAAHMSAFRPPSAGRLRPRGRSALAAAARVDRGFARWSFGSNGAAWMALLFAAFAVHALFRPVSVRDAVAPGYYPMKSIDTLATLPAGRVLNFNSLGGPISWFAGPDYKVFIDTRNDPFPEEIHRQYEQLWRLDPGWQDTLVRIDPDYVLWRSGDPWGALARALPATRRYELVVEEPEGSLWRRQR